MPAEGDPDNGSAGRLVGGRYRLGARLGSGARGEVWSGTDELLRRPVAVKEVRMPPGVPEEEAAELRERALREARAIAVVSHPNVVTLHDVVRENDEPFVVMELLPARGLAELLAARGSLPDDQLAAVADAVAAALQAAHRTGIVHRDVKPGNVLIGESGQIKLGDFGISRNAAEPTLTSSGIVLGTPAFVAPEIASGEEVTGAADLWGLGATLFAAAEGHPPYGADDDPVATVTAVVQGPVPEPTRDTAISEIIRGLMIKDPGARMSLAEVRQRAAPLFAGTRPFEQEAEPQQAPITRPAPPAPSGPSEVEPTPLANDPGPLPFEPKEPPRRRRRWPMVALAATATVVFTTACVGGFAAGKLLMRSTPTSHAPQSRPLPRLAVSTDSANHTRDGGDATFSLATPPGWTVFHEEQDALTNSLTVHDISPNGDSEIAVERFGNYFGKGYSASQYLSRLPEMVGGSAAGFRGGPPTVVGPGTAGQPDLFLAFNTSETGVVDSSAPPREHRGSAEVLRRGSDLWVLRVTVRRENADWGDALFRAVAPTFSPDSP